MKSKRRPMLNLLLPLVCGVALSSLIEWSLLLSIILIVPSLLLLLALHSRVLLYPLVAGFGMLISSIETQTEINKSLYDHQFLVVTGEDNISEVVAHRAAESHPWQRERLKVLFNLDNYDGVTTHSALLGSGNILIDNNKRANPYIAAMSHKGVVGTLILNDYTQVDPSEIGVKIPLSTRVNQWGFERLQRLNLRPTTFASATAMGLARRESLSGELKAEYRKSGTSHILALSGLHFGIVLLIISSLTYLLPLLRNGHIAADAIAIVAIWLFALMAGMGESVQRAAWMFSLLHAASMISKHYNGLNSLFAATTLIILFDPAALFDVGFQLSIIAVLAIFVVGVPLSFRVEHHSKWLAPLTTAIIIGLATSIATMPLAAYTFGGFSILSPLATLPLLITLTIVVMATTLWIIAPLTPLAPIVGSILEVTITIQNWIISWVASWGWGYYDVNISRPQMMLCYMAIAALFGSIRWWLAKKDKGLRKSINQ